MAMLEFDDLWKSYGARPAVRGLTFNVEPGIVYALLGPNGAGKTTALRCLAGLLKPSGGRTRVAGIDPMDDPLRARNRIGYLSASMGLYERISPREVLRFFGTLHGVPEDILGVRVERIIERFGIGEFADRYCGRLSTGQKQRVSIARAVIHDPPALVLDEPTLGLDVVSGETIHAFLFEQREAEKAILLSTHQLDTVEIVADRVGVLARGRLVAEGTVAELMDQTGQPNLARAFLTLIAKGRREVEELERMRESGAADAESTAS
jgi:sodium transport system ATP-binding protein